MSKKIYPLLLVALLTSTPLSSASGDDGALIRSALRSFSAGLKAGNTAVIEAWIGGKLLDEKKVLLRKNKAYSQFLRQYYRGATFEVANVTHTGGQASAELIITFPSGKSQDFPLRLIKGPALEGGGGPPLQGLGKPLQGLGKELAQNGWRVMKHIHRPLGGSVLHRRQPTSAR